MSCCNYAAPIAAKLHGQGTTPLQQLRVKKLAAPLDFWVLVSEDSTECILAAGHSYWPLLHAVTALWFIMA